jgi:hypothetical protein
MSSRLSKMTDPLDALLCGHTVLPTAVPDDDTSSCAAAGELVARRSVYAAGSAFRSLTVSIPAATARSAHRRVAE